MGIFLSETFFLSQENSRFSGYTNLLHRLPGLPSPAVPGREKLLDSRSNADAAETRVTKWLMKLIIELFYVEFRFKAFEKDSFFKSFHRSEKKNWVWPDLDSNPSNKSFKKTSFVGNERLIFLLNSKPWNLSVQSNHMYLEKKPSLLLQNPSQSKRQISKGFFLDLGRVERKHFGRWIDK